MNRLGLVVIVGVLTGAVTAGTALAQTASGPPSPQVSSQDQGQSTQGSTAPNQPQPGRFARQHPRRAEVLARDNRLNNQIQADKGQLGGHYGQLMREGQAIKNQEQADAKANGGYITKGQQRQLNREENRLHRQINRDHRRAQAHDGKAAK